jgi:hypothetical protein
MISSPKSAGDPPSVIAPIGEAHLHLGIAQGVIDRGVEYFNDRRGSILWDTKPVPAAGLIPRQKLRDRWCAGKRVRRRRACDRESYKSPRLDVGHRGRQGLEQNLHLPSEHVGQRRGGAAVGDVHEVYPCRGRICALSRRLRSSRGIHWGFSTDSNASGIATLEEFAGKML